MIAVASIPSTPCALSLAPAHCRYVFQTSEGTPFVFTGTGTGGWEAALTNTLSPGKRPASGVCWLTSGVCLLRDCPGRPLNFGFCMIDRQLGHTAIPLACWYNHQAARGAAAVMAVQTSRGGGVVPVPPAEKSTEQQFNRRDVTVLPCCFLTVLFRFTLCRRCCCCWDDGVSQAAAAVCDGAMVVMCVQVTRWSRTAMASSATCGLI